MKQTVMWLAFTLLFAIIILSITVYSFGPAATAETAGPATSVEAPQPVVAANAKPAQPEVPVAMLDDAPLKPTIGSEAFARWIVEPGASAATRTAEGCRTGTDESHPERRRATSDGGVISVASPAGLCTGRV